MSNLFLLEEFLRVGQYNSPHLHALDATIQRKSNLQYQDNQHNEYLACSCIPINNPNTFYGGIDGFPSQYTVHQMEDVQTLLSRHDPLFYQSLFLSVLIRHSAYRL